MSSRGKPSKPPPDTDDDAASEALTVFFGFVPAPCKKKYLNVKDNHKLSEIFFIELHKFKLY